MADSSPPMVWNQADQERDQHKDGLRGVGVHGKGLQRNNGQQKDDGEAGEQDAERDLVRRLLPGRAVNERDHAIQERLTGLDVIRTLIQSDKTLCRR